MNNTEHNGIVMTKFSWYLLYDMKSVRLVFHGFIDIIILKRVQYCNGGFQRKMLNIF